MGPIQQVKRMFEQHRILATLVFLVSIGVTLLMAFKVGFPHQGGVQGLGF